MTDYVYTVHGVRGSLTAQLNNFNGTIDAAIEVFRTTFRDFTITRINGYNEVEDVIPF